MKVCFLVPAYNCADTIAEVCGRIPLRGTLDEIIVLDDGSSDGTSGVAAALPHVSVTRRERNAGYGRTNAELYRLALEHGAEATVTLHGDLGHRPEDAALLLDALEAGADVVAGSRLLYLRELVRREGWRALLDRSNRHGMPLARALGHFGLTALQNACFGTDLHSFHDGMRACDRRALEWATGHEFSGWYMYDTDLLLAAHRAGLRIVEVPVSPSYGPREGSSAPPIRYGVRVARHALSQLLARRAVRSARPTPR